MELPGSRAEGHCLSMDRQPGVPHDSQPNRKEKTMAYYVKSDPIYDNVTYNRADARASAKRIKKVLKQPTSVALDPSVIRQLRREAVQRGIPYQVLMRMLIVEGLRNLKKAS